MISVVVPAFNEEEYIGECLKSLTAQDYKGEYEVLVVNNSSTDNTVNIAGSYGVRIVNCQEKGVINARQKGTEEARGDIIVQADADTLYPADWLSGIHRHFSSDGRISAVAGFFYYREPPTWSWLEYWIRKTGNNILGKPFLKRPLFVSGANFAFRKDDFIKAGGYNHDEMYPDQWGICRSLSRAGKIKYDPSLIAYTSCRRVKKPFIKILFEAARNLANVIRYFLVTSRMVKSASGEKNMVHREEPV